MIENAELFEMFRADRAIRKALAAGEQVDWGKAKKEDRQRRERVGEMIKQNMLHTNTDFYHASLIMQHGATTNDYKLANELATKAMELGETRAPWMVAATLDRWLLEKGEPFQKYGTQYRKNPETGKFERFPIDPSTTDEERATYGLPTKKELEEQINKLNSK